MPIICPICSKPCRSDQKAIECSTCLKWCHHANRIHCSGLTDHEFEVHVNNVDLIYTCDKCVAKNTYNNLKYLPHHHEPFVDIDPFKTSKKQNIFNSAQKNYGDFISKCSELGSSLNDTEDEADYFSNT